VSHFSRIQTQLKDKKYLLQALQDLGYSFSEGDLTVKGFGGRKASASIVVHLPMSYDIGFTVQNGNYHIVADWIGVHGINRVKFINELSQRYAYHATRDKLEQQGFSVIEEKQEDGAVRILLRRSN